MEEDLNVFLNGRRPAGWLAYLALASPELGTAQPQLVCIYLSTIYVINVHYISFCCNVKDKLPTNKCN